MLFSSLEKLVSSFITSNKSISQVAIIPKGIVSIECILKIYNSKKLLTSNCLIIEGQ